jgi:hypothetical protein
MKSLGQECAPVGTGVGAVVFGAMQKHSGKLNHPRDSRNRSNKEFLSGGRGGHG